MPNQIVILTLVRDNQQRLENKAISDRRVTKLCLSERFVSNSRFEECLTRGG
jgi:hypothetical protein